MKHLKLLNITYFDGEKICNIEVACLSYRQLDDSYVLINEAIIEIAGTIEKITEKQT